MKIYAWCAILTVAAVLGVWAQPLPASNACGDLTSLKLSDVTITSATIMPAGMSAATDTSPTAAYPAYCKVLGTAKPTSDSDIRFEVMIPDGNAWNGRYMQIGNSGFAGAIPEKTMRAALAQGYAVAGTDDGHQTTIFTDVSWAIGHPEKLIDFGYRALKETTDAAKAIISSYKSSDPKYSYFQGCSDGGREALMEAQRYPDDFNGIVAGDPSSHLTHLIADVAWNFQALTATPGSFVPPAKLKVIEAEAVKQCGDANGVIEDPMSCHFDPSKIRCVAGDNPTCLTDAQLTALDKIYRGPRNPRTGEQIMDGFFPGGEGEEPGGWVRNITGAAPDGKQSADYAISSNFLRYVVFDNPNYDVRKLNFDGDITRMDAKFANIFNSYNPDLSAFRKHGGKLIQYHGWADPGIPALDSVNYYKLVQTKMGPTSNFYRLFMAPGMLHCASGPGPNVIATLPAIAAWVEQGKAPEALIATKYRSDNPSLPVERSRPLCSFPARAQWDGKGDKNRWQSFRCVASGN